MCAGEGGFEASQVSQEVEATDLQGVACDTLRNSESVTEVSQAIVQGPRSKVQGPKSKGQSPKSKGPSRLPASPDQGDRTELFPRGAGTGKGLTR